MSFEISKQYRTAHSIKDADVEQILSCFAGLPEPSVFVDFGCHLGHLSIEIALQFEVTVFAVDTFTGTAGDNKMKATILEIAPTGNFRAITQANAHACEHQFKGSIKLMTSEEFFATDFCFDMIFIDGSHKLEDAQEFGVIGGRISQHGIVSGHDYNMNAPGVMKGIEYLRPHFKMIPSNKAVECFFMEKR